MRVCQLREAQQQIRHFIASLSAGHEDDDLGVRPLGQLVLDDCFPAPEGTGNTGCPTFGQRKEGVEDSLTRTQGLIRHQAFFDFPVLPDRPRLVHPDLFGALLGFDPGHDLFDREFSFFDL